MPVVSAWLVELRTWTYDNHEINCTACNTPPRGDRCPDGLVERFTEWFVGGEGLEEVG